jgi:hypothetical protein
MVESSPTLRIREPKDGPWCWQSKAARRRIREAFDATNNVASALSVYDALCEIASDDQSEVFTTTHAWIQRISGVGISTIKKHLAVLSEVGLVTISTPRLRAPSTFVLLPFGNGCPTVSQPPPNASQPLPNVSQCSKFEPLATSEESQKNLLEKNLRRTEITSPPKGEEVISVPSKQEKEGTAVAPRWNWETAKIALGYGERFQWTRFVEDRGMYSKDSHDLDLQTQIIKALYRGANPDAISRVLKAAPTGQGVFERLIQAVRSVTPSSPPQP